MPASRPWPTCCGQGSLATVEAAATIEEAITAEAEEAGAYWASWSDVEVRLMIRRGEKVPPRHPGGSALGAFELDDNEALDGAIICREGEPDRRVVGRIESDDPERFDVLVVERS